MVTTIQIEESLKGKLDTLKIHRRETYNELIKRIIGSQEVKEIGEESLKETIEILSDPKTMRDLARALEDFEKGNFVELI